MTDLDASFAFVGATLNSAIDRQLSREEHLLVEVDDDLVHHEDLELHEGIEDHPSDDEDVFIPILGGEHVSCELSVTKRSSSNFRKNRSIDTITKSISNSVKYSNRVGNR